MKIAISLPPSFHRNTLLNHSSETPIVTPKYVSRMLACIGTTEVHKSIRTAPLQNGSAPRSSKFQNESATKSETKSSKKRSKPSPKKLSPVQPPQSFHLHYFASQIRTWNFKHDFKHNFKPFLGVKFPFLFLAGDCAEKPILRYFGVDGRFSAVNRR